MTARQITSSTPAPDFEIVVIELLGPDETRNLATELEIEAVPEEVPVRIVNRSGSADSIPQRRRRAAASCEAPVVFLIEDTTRLAPGWAAALRAEFSDDRVAAACGPVCIEAGLAPHYRALGRLEYGRFDGAHPAPNLTGNAFAVRLKDLQQALLPDEELIEHELERRLLAQDRQIKVTASLASTYSLPDRHGARLATRFGHGRIYGADRSGNRISGLLRAILAMPMLSLRAFRAARAAGPASQWLPEMPWIVAMSAAWSLGEFVGQLAGRGNSQASWN